jgi:hypothetical protein
MDQDRRDFLRGAARAGAVALAGSTLARAAPARGARPRARRAHT